MVHPSLWDAKKEEYKRVNTSTLQQDIFFIGSFTDGAITFPYIDENGMLRSLKRQQYDKDIGKRSKTENSYLLHKILSGNDNFNYKGCLFGMHQIRTKYNKNKPICIVEGEKSAIIASGAMPNIFGWLQVPKTG